MAEVRETPIDVGTPPGDQTHWSAPAVFAERGRVEAFSDGVFAIAITLLALDLKLPSGVTRDGHADLVRPMARVSGVPGLVPIHWASFGSTIMPSLRASAKSMGACCIVIDSLTAGLDPPLPDGDACVCLAARQYQRSTCRVTLYGLTAMFMGRPGCSSLRISAAIPSCSSPTCPLGFSRRNDGARCWVS